MKARRNTVRIRKKDERTGSHNEPMGPAVARSILRTPAADAIDSSHLSSIQPVLANICAHLGSKPVVRGLPLLQQFAQLGG